MSFVNAFNSAEAIIQAELQLTLFWRGSMLLSIITGPLFILVQAAVWKGLFASSTTGIIGGFTYDAMITYFAIGVLIQYLTWNYFDGHVMTMISEGGLTQYLLKPHSYFLLLFYRKVTNRIIAFIIEFLPVLLIVIALGVPFSIQQPLWFVVFAAIAFFLVYCTNILLGMLSFWLTKPRGFIWSWNFLKGFLLGTLIPLSLFPAWYQQILGYTPFPYFVYIPARIAMGLPVEIGTRVVSIEIAAIVGLMNVIGMISLLCIAWHYGTRRYTGVGQ